MLLCQINYSALMVIPPRANNIAFLLRLQLLFVRRGGIPPQRREGAEYRGEIFFGQCLKVRMRDLRIA
jgi:hypothetical protein